MAETLYDMAEHLRTQILSSSDREKTAADFFSNRGYALKREDVVVLDDGTPIIRDDPGRNYDIQQLQQLKDDISGQLSLFSEEDLPRQDPGRGNARTGEEGSGRDARKVRNVSGRQNPILRDGVSAYYSPEKGWNGKEQHPWTVKGAWDKFGFVDFLGMDVRDAHDIAQMFSIYRNPMLEYFHIILAKDGKLVRQMAMTSGLSGLVKVIPSGGADELKKVLSDIDYDSAYLVHNHPSGDISPSDDDLRCTGFYINEIFKDRFKGHIILDHDMFALISALSPDVRTFMDMSVTDLSYTPHAIPKPRTKSERRIVSPGDVARVAFDLHNKGNITLDLDNERKVRSFTQFSVDDYDPLLFMIDMKKNCIRDRVIIVSTLDDYYKLEKEFKKTPNKIGGTYMQPVLDCLYIDPDKGTYISMKEHGLISTYNWQNFLAKTFSESKFIWNEDISDHPKQGYLFENTPHYIPEFIEPSWKERDNFTDDLASYEGKGSISVLDTSDVLETIGYPPGKVVISESAIRNAMDDTDKKEVLNDLPVVAIDPTAVIDTGVKVDKNSKNCLLFAYNMFVDGFPATVGLLVEPVESKRRTEYVIQAIYSPEEMSQEDNKLFSVCAKNNQFLYSASEQPCFFIPRKAFNKPPRSTAVNLPNKIPHRKAILNHQADKATRNAKKETRR